MSDSSIDSGNPQRPVRPSQGNAPTTESSIKILSHQGDIWDVELFFPLTDVSEEQLSVKLGEVKSLLEKQYDLSGSLLRYQKMLGSQVSSEGVHTRLRLEKAKIKSGRPEFSYESAISPAGEPYNEMSCYADLMFIDEFDKELTEERLLSLMKHNNIPQELIDFKTISTAIKVLHEKKTPLHGVRIAHGIFPEPGSDAEVEFYFHANPGKENINEYVSSKKVEKGDILCSKTPPVTGKREGLNVRGKVLKAGSGLDVQLVPGKNVICNSEGTTLTANLRGLVVVKREEKQFMTPKGLKIVPSNIEVRVDPLRVIEAGDEIIEITTDESVEIKGTLKMGSKIVTTGEVHIEGDVSEDAIIQASCDIVVSGMVMKGTLSSDRNVLVKNGITNGNITAGESIIVKGAVNKSNLTGRQIVADEINGGQIIAGEQVTVDRLGADEKGISATICVGMREFLDKKVSENNKFIEDTKKNFTRLKQFFGTEIVRETSSRNIQQMLLKFVSQMPKGEGSYISQQKVIAIKKLLSMIEPLRKVLKEKEIENIRLKRQIKRTSKEKKMVVVKEKVQARTKIQINNTVRTIKPQPGPLKLSEEDLKDLDGIYETD